jgi:uncharacterized protein (DUF305 family)
MIRRWMMLGAPLALALVLLFAPIETTRTTAQMGPTMGQPLDQLSGDEFDKAFLTQMSMHHAMAVMMARPVVANAVHQELRDLGSSIIDDQTREIAQMRSWARDWYGLDIPDHVAMMDAMQGGEQPTQSSQGMAGHEGPGAMPKPGGMAQSGGQGMPMGQMREMSMMADLWKLPANRLEVVFMSMMIPHHQGAIDMAMLVPDRAAHQELKDLAAGIITSQSAEIAQMNGWLATWYGL